MASVPVSVTELRGLTLGTDQAGRVWKISQSGQFWKNQAETGVFWRNTKASICSGPESRLFEVISVRGRPGLDGGVAFLLKDRRMEEGDCSTAHARGVGRRWGRRSTFCQDGARLGPLGPCPVPGPLCTRTPLGPLPHPLPSADRPLLGLSRYK